MANKCFDHEAIQGDDEMNASRQRRNSVESWVSSGNSSGISSILAAADASPDNRIASDAMQADNIITAPNDLMTLSSSSLSEDVQRDRARREKYLSKIYQASHAEKLERYLQENNLKLSDVNAMSLQQVYYTWRVLDRRFRSSAKHKNTKVQVELGYPKRDRERERRKKKKGKIKASWVVFPRIQSIFLYVLFRKSTLVSSIKH